MRKTLLLCLVLLCVTGFISASAQVEKLEGAWKLTTFVEGSEFGAFVIAPDAIGSCTEIIQHNVNKKPYSFELLEKGKVQLNDASVFLYLGGGTASATEEKTVRVVSTIVASGVVAPASNMIAGIWAENQVYTDKLSNAEIHTATPAPFLMIRNGIAPQLPAILVKEIAGDWDFEMKGGTFGLTWDGMVTLNTSGAFIGYLVDSGIVKGRQFPGGGFFSVSTDGTFAFEFTTITTIPVAGEKAITIKGTGKIDSTNTKITGTITATVADVPAGETAAKVSHAYRNNTTAYTADFTMNKKPEESTPTVDLTLTLVSSTFDNDRDGWTIIGDAQDETAIPDYKSTKGNPGGYVEAVDDVYGGTWYWYAPPKFLGDKEKAYNGLLMFDLQESNTSPAFDEYDVVLESADGMRLYYKFDNYPGKSWTNYIIPLNEAGWKVDGAFRPATEKEMRFVLRTLSELWIRGEYLEGDDTGGLDTVYMLSASASPLSDWFLY